MLSLGSLTGFQLLRVLKGGAHVVVYVLIKACQAAEMLDDQFSFARDGPLVVLVIPSTTVVTFS